jgi:hypothetical protein
MMKRAIGVIAVMAFFVSGLAVGVSAEPGRTEPTARQGIQERVQPFNPATLRKLERLMDRSRTLTLRASCPTGPLSIAKINCQLRELTRFAKATQRQLSDLEEFVDTFFDCTSYLPLSQYGDWTQTVFGYVFNTGTPPTLNIPAFAPPQDINIDTYLNVHVVEPTPECIEFAA